VYHFFRAYVGHPKHHAFYNICYLAHNSLTSNGTVPASTDGQSLRDSSQDADSSSPDLSALDVNEHMEENINHVRSLLRHPIQSDRQHDYTHCHHKLGHLSHAHLQELVKQGKLPQRFHSCSPPVCPACLFAKQTKRQWRHKGSGSHSLRALSPRKPGGLAFADQMVSYTPGLIPQSTGHLTKHRYRTATIFVDSFSDYTHVSLQEDLTMDATLDAKLDFERKLSTLVLLSVVIMLIMVTLLMQLGRIPVRL
jgi:hypothetical protein